MKKSIYLIACLSSLFLIPTSEVWSSTQPYLTPNPIISTTSTTDNLKQIAQSITVKVLVNDTAGSGFIVAKEGNLYTVITNAHVVSRGEPYKIQTPDGKVYDAILKREEDAKIGNDLAELEFKSDHTYAVAEIGDTVNLAENQEVYSAGYPYDSDKLTFEGGTISLLSNKPLKGGYQIGFTNKTLQGMSGGVLLNNEGKVIGILGMGSQAILNEAYTYSDNTLPDAQTVARLRESSFAVPSDRLSSVVADNNSIPPPVAYTGIVAEIDNIAQQITVRIDSKNNGNGSGVIVAHQGDTYYVLTAAHVVEKQNDYTIVTPDGESYPLNYSTVHIFEGADLAVIQFRSKKTYTVAKLGKYNLGLETIDSKKINSGWMFVSGFPAITAKNGNPTQRQLTAGRIWSQELADFAVKENYSLSGGQDLVYTALSYPGMSGGVVLDHQGRVIGINTGAENEELISEKIELNIGQSLGVPIGTFIGRTTEAKIQQSWLTIETSKPNAITDAELNTIRTQLITLKAPSSNGDAYDWLNYCNGLWRSFQFDKAVVACQQAIDSKADFYQAYYVKGLSLLYPGNYQQALVAFEQVTKIDSQFYPAWRWQGLTFILLKKYSEALSAYEQALLLKKDDLVLYVEKGDVLRELKRYQEAIATYTEALNIKLHPWAYNNRGLAYSELKDYQRAIADYNQAIALNPELAQTYINRGSAYLELKNYERAIADYTQALSINSELAQAQAYYNRGIAYAHLKDYERAIADYNQAIALNPELADAYNNRGSAYEELKDYQNAIADYTQALSINPELALGYYNRGIAYTRLKDYERAISDYTQALSINSEYKDAYNNRGITYVRLQDYERAIADFTQAIALNSEDADAHYNRGLTYHIQGNYKAALADYNQAISLDQNNFSATNNIGLIKYEMGAIEEAIQKFQQAININNQSAEPQLALAVVLYTQGEKEKALQFAQSALQLDKNFAKVEYLKQKRWGEKLINDAQKLLSEPTIQVILSR